MIPRLPGQPPGLDTEPPVVLWGAALEETMVAETFGLEV